MILLIFFSILFFLNNRAAECVIEPNSTHLTMESKKRMREDAKTFEISIIREEELKNLDRDE